MNDKFYIIGSGGFAKEVYFLASEALENRWHFGGFITATAEEQKNVNYGNIKLPVITEDLFLSQIAPVDKVILFMGIGNPKLIEKLSVKFKGYNFPNLIHPNFVGNRQAITIGMGNLITAGCVFTTDIIIGSFNVFNLNVTVGHDSVIGDCNIFNPGANISGSVNIGNNNLFGTNAAVLQGLKIQDNNVIGAASLVNKNIADGKIMVGVPAKELVKV